MTDAAELVKTDRQRALTDRLRNYGAKFSQIDPEYLMCIEAAAEIERIAAQQDGAWQPIETCPIGKRVMFWWRPIDRNPYAESTVIGSLCSDDKEGQWWNGQRGEYQSAWHLTHWHELPGKPQDRRDEQGQI